MHSEIIFNALKKWTGLPLRILANIQKGNSATEMVRRSTDRRGDCALSVMINLKCAADGHEAP